MQPIVLVHGGAGEIPDHRVAVKLEGVKKSAQIGYDILVKGGSVVDAVEAAVRYMEDDEAFNCGEFIFCNTLYNFYTTNIILFHNVNSSRSSCNNNSSNVIVK